MDWKNLALIPSWNGGSPVQNIGHTTGQAEDVIEQRASVSICRVSSSKQR